MTRTVDIIDPKAAKTLAGLFRERVRRTPRACAYRRFNVEERRFEEIAWEEVFDRAACWQVALLRQGLVPGDRVAVMLKNCLEWVLFDLAALGLGLVTVPLPAEDRPANSAFILRQTGARFLLIEDEEQWLRIKEVDDQLAGIERIVTLRPLGLSNFHPDACKDEQADRVPAKSYPGDSGEAGVDNRSGRNSNRDPRLAELAQWLPEKGGEYVMNCREATELATIVYTSGTTGLPKGVMLSHANILQNAFACLQRESIYPDDQFLSFLPLSHTFERTVGYYIPMMAGACVAFVRSIEKISEDMREIRPTVLVSVPRIYERIHRKIAMELEEKPAPIRYLFSLAVEIGWKRFLYLQGRGRWTPLFLSWPLLNRIVAKRVMAGLGGRLRLSISGGAPLALPIARVFLALGLNLLQGYGQTETSPVVAVNTVNDNIPTTVGRPLPAVELAISNEGELLIKGPTVMLGYWQSRRATAAAFSPDGYLYTGDVARMDESGHLIISGRLKEIIALSTGEKVPPEGIELAIAVNPLFEQVMVVGEGRPYLAALVVLNRSQWEKLAAGHGIASDQPELLADNRVESILLSEITRRMTRFPGYAQIRRVHATLTPWTAQDGFITGNLKLRRKALLARFEREVASLFTGHEPPQHSSGNKMLQTTSRERF
jgi:long-chain acyl-CoA synthetase